MVEFDGADAEASGVPHPSGRRATLVALTDKGNATMDGLRAEYDAGAARLFDGIAEADLKGFVATVDHLLARIVQEDC